MCRRARKERAAVTAGGKHRVLRAEAVDAPVLLGGGDWGVGVGVVQRAAVRLMLTVPSLLTVPLALYCRRGCCWLLVVCWLLVGANPGEIKEKGGGV